MKKYLLLLIVLLLITLVAVSGCSRGEEILEDDGSTEYLPSDNSYERDDSTVVKDQMGREVVVKGIPGRIISLSPSNTEIAFALGLGERLVGVTDFCNYPSEVLDKAKIGGFSNPSIEKIVELEPELVLASTIHVDEVPRLEELGIPVLVIESSALFDLYRSISLVAELAGVIPAGETLIAAMQSRISAVETVVSAIQPGDRVRVFYEVYSDPLMTAGQGAFVNEIIALAGGVNVFGDVEENYPQISAEVVAERQPEIILYPDYHGTADLVMEAMMTRPGWESLPAVIERRVHAISDDSFARPGPRVVEAVEEAARLFYPELF